MTKEKFLKSIITFIIILCACLSLLMLYSCDMSKGQYFVDSEYIIAKASLTSTVKNATTGEIEYYGIDITHDTDLKLTHLKYKCELYSNGKVIETFEDEVPMNGLYSRYIPLKTTKEYEHAKVTCTGYSNEDPKNYVRLNAKSFIQMQQCEHKNLINAKVKSTQTNNKYDYLIINYTSNTAYNNFRFCYENYVSITTEDIKVCLDCGFYET